MNNKQNSQPTPADQLMNDRADNIAMATIIAAIMAAGVVPAACREFGRPHKQPASGSRSELLQPPPAQPTPPQTAPEAPKDKENLEPQAPPKQPIPQHRFSRPVIV